MAATPVVAPPAAPEPVKPPEPQKPLDPAVSAAIDAVEAVRGKEDVPFETLAPMVDALDAALAAATDDATRARIELARLRAILQVLDGLPFDGAFSAAQKAFLAKHERVVFEHQIAGRWYLNDMAVWPIATKYAATASAEALAWLAAKCPADGECEGDPACYLGRVREAEARYLKQFPSGAHADEALAAVQESLPATPDELSMAEEFGVESITDARASLKELLPIVSAAASPKKAAVLEAMRTADAALQKALATAATAKTGE